MSADMNTRLADLALRMATVFSAPSAEVGETSDVRTAHHPVSSLLGEDLPQLAEAMLVLALRMLDPILAALRHLAADTPEEGVLEKLAGPDAQRFDSDRIRIATQDGRLTVKGCNALPAAFLPWIASNLVGAGALLVPHPFSDPESLRRHIGETLLRIERLTAPRATERPIAQEPREAMRTRASGEITPGIIKASAPATTAPESAETQMPSPETEPESAHVLTGSARADPYAPKR